MIGTRWLGMTTTCRPFFQRKGFRIEELSPRCERRAQGQRGHEKRGQHETRGRKPHRAHPVRRSHRSKQRIPMACGTRRRPGNDDAVAIGRRLAGSSIAFQALCFPAWNRAAHREPERPFQKSRLSVKLWLASAIPVVSSSTLWRMSGNNRITAGLGHQQLLHRGWAPSNPPLRRSGPHGRDPWSCLPEDAVPPGSADAGNNPAADLRARWPRRRIHRAAPFQHRAPDARQHNP